jgi:hypothetical protein
MTADPNELDAFREQAMEWPDENAELDAPERTGFVITSDGEAASVMRRLARWQRETDRIAQIVADERAQIAAFEQANLGTKDDPRGAAREVWFYESVLVDYYRRLEDADPETPQTHKVPGGWMGRRKNPDSVEVTDPDAFVTWAIANDRGDLVGDIKPASKSDLKAALTPQADPAKAAHGETMHFVDADGVVIPGVMYRVGADRYEAKPKATEKP